MDDSDGFTEELGRALRHLRDAGYQPTEILSSILGCGTQVTIARIQSAIVHAIGGLEPSCEIHRGARSGLLFKILDMRYVAGCTQEQTAEVLGISVRHLNRLQHEAVHQLALRLLEEHQFGRSSSAESRAADAPGMPGGSPPESTADSWQAQVMQEVLALGEQSGNVTEDLGRAIREAFALVRSMDETFEYSIQDGQESPTVSVRVHPSALRQILLAVTTELLSVVPHSRLRCEVELSGELAIVTLGADGSPLPHQMDIDSAQELVVLACGGSISQTQGKTGVSVTIRLPTCERKAERFTVLAIDDNADLITLFGAYCEGTPYDLVHVREGCKALEAVEGYRPDVVLLDVMLPDIDGWDILQSLSASPACSATPIIVCSVMADEKLALALGAKACLHKPVWRRQLLDALDAAVNRTPA